MEYPFKYGPDHVSHKLRDYFRAAKIEKASLHTLRRTYGSILVQEKYADIYRVSKYLGHSSVKVTEKHYIHLLEDDHESMSNNLDEYYGSLSGEIST